MIVDVEHHGSTLDNPMLEKGSGKSGLYCERYWGKDGKMKVRTYASSTRTEERLQFMDTVGIDMAVLSSNPLKTLEEAREWNDHCAAMVKEYPKRFAGFASVPPLAGKPSLKELERAIKGLGLCGAHIGTRNEGLHLDSREMWPFYEKMQELKVPVDIHVTLEPAGYDAVQAPYALYYIMAREVDMLVETYRICLGGVLEDFPDLKIIMNHFGSGISATLERMDAYLDYEGPGCPSIYPGKPLITKPWRTYFNKLYFNIAGREMGINALNCALTNINPRRLMFGSDWPFNYDHNPAKARKYLNAVRKLDLPREDIEGILGGNAVKLLKLGR
jgi:predicted TIM-barrel fold metal-dependent hydrolase